MAYKHNKTYLDDYEVRICRKCFERFWVKKEAKHLICLPCRDMEKN